MFQSSNNHAVIYLDRINCVFDSCTKLNLASRLVGKKVCGASGVFVLAEVSTNEDEEGVE